MMQTIKHYTGIPPVVVCALIVAYLIWNAIEGNYNEFIAICFGTLYPMFKSVQALQTENDFDDDKVWLTYWCVYGFIIVIDKYEIDFILEMLPCYFLVKLVLYTWL